MRSSILISRIARVVETEGAVGNGATLAEEYTKNVGDVNRRLEAVQAFIDAKQVSEAVRMLEDAPRLLDEVATLDFNQLPDWETLCSINNWAPPAKLDKMLLEYVIMFSESTEVVESFLRMYRKAVRINDNKLAIKSLRRLVEIDHSQNWKTNLVQTEESAKKQLIADFRAAKSAGNKEEMERVAQEFIETNWSNPLSSKGVDEIHAYIAAKEEASRNAEGTENLSIIKQCMNEKWNRQLAFSMVQAIDRLTEKGWVIPTADREIVDLCRKRCCDEMEAEAKERRWKELCENLHAAIQQENTSAIRDVLSAPEFLDREPDEELIRQAQLVIQHEETAQRRKMRQISLCVLTVLIAVLGVSGWWLKQKLFNDRCEAEAIKLAALQKGAHAVDRLTEALRQLQENEPEVYADPRVNVFDGKLKTMRTEMIARTNEIGNIIAELRAMQDANWNDATDSVTGRIDRVETLLTKDDDTFHAEFSKLKLSWNEQCEKIADAKRNAASRFQEVLVSHINVVANKLKTELTSPSLSKEVASCKASVDEWNRVHSQNAPALQMEIDKSVKTLGEAENMQRNLEGAIAKLKGATTAKEYLEARKALTGFYSNYPFVKVIGEHPITPEDAEAVVAKTTVEQKDYANIFEQGVSEDEFKKFLDEEVKIFTESRLYSLYGVYTEGNKNFGCVSISKPQIKKVSYDKGYNYRIEGELLRFSRLGTYMTKQIPRHIENAKLNSCLLESSAELQHVVDIASRDNINIGKFEAELVKLIGKHIKVAKDKDFFDNEVKIYKKEPYLLKGHCPPIRRIQLVSLYLQWLRDDLKLIPQTGVLKQWIDEIQDLAEPVHVDVDGIEKDLTWTCMTEVRVREHNSKCANLLKRMADQDFIEKYKSLKSFMRELRRVNKWNIEYAGCISYDPYDLRWVKDHSIAIPVILPTVKKDHPLYILRRENGKLALKRALAPYKNGTEWQIPSAETKASFVAGDPLFQISEDGKCIDTEAKLEKIFNGIPAGTIKQFRSKIPLFAQ